MSLPNPREIDLIGKINREIDANFSQSEINFLIYIGWKALGWALVFVSVMLILRFLKLWLLHTWERELSPENRRRPPSARRQLEMARTEAIDEIRAARRQRRRERIRQRLMERRFSEPIRGTAATTGNNLDSPPNYEDIVQNDDNNTDDVTKDDESLPPTYASIYQDDPMTTTTINPTAESSRVNVNIPNNVEHK